MAGLTVVRRNGRPCARWQCVLNLSLMKPVLSQLMVSLLEDSESEEDEAEEAAV